MVLLRLLRWEANALPVAELLSQLREKGYRVEGTGLGKGGYIYTARRESYHL